MHGLFALVLMAMAGAVSHAAAPAKAPAPAPPTLAIDGLDNGAITLDGPWQFHIGDDMAWADPGFDDSGWQAVPFPQAATQSRPSGGSAFAWYRVRIPVSDGAAQHAILLPAVNTSYQVFADGRLIASYGALPPHPKLLVSQPQMILIPGSSGQYLTLAVRLWTFAGVNDYDSSAVRVDPQFGTPAFVRQQLEIVHLKARLSLTITYIVVIFSVLGALATGALYLSRRGEKEYLWLALYLFMLAALNTLWTLRVNFAISYFSCGVVQNTLFAGTSLAQLLLFRRLLKGSWNWFFWCAFSADLVLYATMLAGLAGVSGSWRVPYFLWIVGDLYFPSLAIQGARKGMPDARLMLIPVCVIFPLWFIQDSLSLWGYLGLKEPFEGNLLYREFQSPFPFSFPDIASLLFIVGMMAIMIHRFARVTRQEEEHANEMEAARVVQQVLVPADIPAIPGFLIQSVYKPFGQVGGDFFQILPAQAGGVLAVIGDVSGKGMPAAMTVSLLVGTLRTLAHYTQSPGEILGAMNQRMLARSHGGFTTCLVLRADADGTLTVANAGHIAPYLAGKELAIENGLPLGLADGTAYAESCFQLAPGEQLTLLTDGVIEARDKAGALFGFDRTAAISRESAENVAQAAQAFGQDDDITVLTLRRLAAGEASTTQSTAPALAPA
jgi:hypothetical protein